MASRFKDFVTGRTRRKTVNLLQQPAVQLKLPLYVLAITIGLALAIGAQGYVAYDRIIGLMVAQQPEPVATLLSGQTRDFITISAAITVAYALLVLVVSVVYVHRMVGPMVAFRRHLEALKNGDYGSRVNLRKNDAFMELQDDLNELAEILAEGGKPEPPTAAAPEAPAS